VIDLDQVASVRLTREPTRGGAPLLPPAHARRRDGADRLGPHPACCGPKTAAPATGAGQRPAGARPQPECRRSAGAVPDRRDAARVWGVVLGLALLLGATACCSCSPATRCSPRACCRLALVALGAPNLVRWLTSNRRARSTRAPAALGGVLEPSGPRAYRRLPQRRASRRRRRPTCPPRSRRSPRRTPRERREPERPCPVEQPMAITPPKPSTGRQRDSAPSGAGFRSSPASPGARRARTRTRRSARTRKVTPASTRAPV